MKIITKLVSASVGLRLNSFSSGRENIKPNVLVDDFSTHCVMVKSARLTPSTGAPSPLRSVFY